MDPLAEFIAARCVLGPHAAAWKGALYAAYRSWCSLQDQEPMSVKAFGMSIAERGIADGRVREGRYWTGIELLPSEIGDAS
jgi:phage/plasmid-associated DNA primase